MMRKIKGFTMVELLVVISIIGILASIVLVSFTSSQKQARDVQRKSDLKQYQTALESFANSNDGLYPGRSGTSKKVDPDLCVDLSLPVCQVDPKNEDPYIYYYQGGTGQAGCGGGTICATQYTLRVKLESTDFLWIVCSTGESGEILDNTSFEDQYGACQL